MIKLETPRLLLRPIEINDLEAIHSLHSLPETDEFNTLGLPESIDVTREVILPWLAEHAKDVIGQYTFAIEFLNSEHFVGLIAIVPSNTKYRKAEIWYKLNSAYWGKGLATEALKATIEFGFQELHLHRIEASCAVNNIRSVRVLEKVGMQLEGTKRKVLPLKSGWSDAYSYSLLLSDIS